ncbi:hypothetical protein CAAN4_H12640 [[Candida] anglica]|uniref:Uncharacterized protein n=1 Tax=[Candida] anglica TaxID=148631 RepID=A0ABP0ELT5_9ASCO
MSQLLDKEINRTPSLSSLSSDGSTRDLIESLETKSKPVSINPNDSYSELYDRTLEPVDQKENKTIGGEREIRANDKPPQTTSISPPLTENESSKTFGTLPKKKPIRFTVRKVSHDLISSPDSNSYSTSSRKTSGTSVSSNSSPTTDSIAAANAEKNMAYTQQKYDQYAKKIEKITKEIEFLQNLLPPYNVEVDYATRLKINNAVEKLKAKQDELSKKKYLLGISISRLWRNMDDSDIWVRSMGKQ